MSIHRLQGFRLNKPLICGQLVKHSQHLLPLSSLSSTGFRTLSTHTQQSKMIGQLGQTWRVAPAAGRPDSRLGV